MPLELPKLFSLFFFPITSVYWLIFGDFHIQNFCGFFFLIHSVLGIEDKVVNKTPQRCTIFLPISLSSISLDLEKWNQDPH